MLLLRREYRDGAEPPEIVLLHAEVTRHGDPGGPLLRFTRAVVPTETPGRRVAHLPLPEPGEGERVLVRYRFSTVLGGEERFSPWYEVVVPSDDAIADLYRIPEEGASNLPPAPGRGHFRLVLPLGEGERASGPFRFGFGAMRKKPSPSLCRAAIDAGYGPAPVIEAPEALSVLKNRPMPYFLYARLRGRKTARRQDRVRSHRLRRSRRDRRLRQNDLGRLGLAGHEPLPHGGKGGCAAGPFAASEEFFAEDRAAFLAARETALSLLSIPRVFEAFVFGPSGSGVEYCFQTVARRAGRRPARSARQW